jgi:glycine/D-amino acid oxidase-like deaminating enzyme
LRRPRAIGFAKLPGVIHDAQGWWLRQEPPVEPLAPLAGDASADVVVVGGGFAGMWTAWLVHEAEPEARVLLLEADLCGHGPTGRNGGFVNSMWFSLPSMRSRFGELGAIEVARAAQRAVDEIGEWCDSQGVEAWYRRGGYLQISTTQAHDETWLPTVEACQELGEPDAVEVLAAADVRARCASPMFRAGAFFPGSATVNPARLALGLRAKLIETGVEVCERSQVTGLRVSDDGVEARTAGGAVRAGHAVLAAGGAQEALPPLRRRLTLTSSHMVITEPVPDLIEEIGWTGGECITDARHLLHYFRTTPDGRIAFGWGGGRMLAGARVHGHAEVDAGVAVKVARQLVRFFPGLAGRRIDHAWGGPIDVSPSHTPVVGSLDGRVHYGFGFTGNGVGPSRMVAHALASLALDRRDEHSRLAIVEPEPLHVPPEPFRYIGGAIVREAFVRKEEAEETGREPDPISEFVAAIPERIGVQIGR